MLNYRKELLAFAIKFIDICEKENIWYSLDRETLLGAIKHGGFVPWEKHFDVMINVQGYRDLKRIYSQNIIDSRLDYRYKSLDVSFVEDNKQWNKEQPFIGIRVLVPTTVEKISRFSSLLKKLWNFIIFKKDNINHAINDIIEERKYEGYYLLHKKREFNNKNWIQKLSKKTIEVNFSGIKAKIITEYDEVLKSWYGEYLKNTNVPKLIYSYAKPISKVRVKE